MVRGTGKGKAKADTPGKKPETRTRKPRQKAGTKADQLPERQTLEVQVPQMQGPVDATVAPAENSAIEIAVIEPAPVVVAQAESPPIETAAVEAAAIEPVTIDIAPAPSAPVDDLVPTQPAPAPAPAPVSYQAITNAYGDYTRKSIEQTSSFFEQLAGARSFNRAFQLQTEYAQQAYETFVAEAQKIRDMHRELTRQRLKSFEGLVTGSKGTRSK
jgi:hypothetical protein